MHGAWACTASLPLPVVGFAVTIWLAQVAGPPWTADGNPSWLALLTAAAASSSPRC
jgi:hypothetical protein